MKNDDRTRYTFRMPDALYRKLQERADDLGVSMNALILQILWDRSALWSDTNDSVDDTDTMKGVHP